MADLIFGVDRGQQSNDVVNGSSSPDKDVEVVIDRAVGLTKQEVLIKLDEIKQNILKYPW